MRSVFDAMRMLAIGGICWAVLGTTGAYAQAITLNLLGTYESGLIDADGGGQEIPAYDRKTKRLFVVNAIQSRVDILNIADPTTPTFVAFIDVTLALAGGSPNSVAVSKKGVVAVAIQAPVKTDPGAVGFFNTNGALLGSVPVGALPDMLTWTPNEKSVLVANEGEPSDDYLTDPEGTVSIITVPRNFALLSPASVRSVIFQSFNDDTDLDPSIRIFGPGATFAQDVEPEYITVSPDSKTAYVSLQEANAIAVIDIKTGTVTAIHGLGFKNHLLPGNGLDPSRDDGGINIGNWPLMGMYQPDGLACYKFPKLGTLVFSANEGDTRAYTGFNEEFDIRDMDVGETLTGLDADGFPGFSASDLTDLVTDAQLGRLRISTVNADPGGDGDANTLFSFGGRSFSIWHPATGEQVYDSGDDIEQRCATAFPANFNADHEDRRIDRRSPRKGPEPEDIKVAKIGKSVYAFIALERQSAIMIYNVTNPLAPAFVSISSNRDYAATDLTPEAGDLGPEGMLFIPAQIAPTRQNLLVVANEVSGTTSIWAIVPAP
ncbi:MAG: alkaline phosphatase [Planctomycetes bacterium]|nr:alkaline phosphatase [Planctomycetota bacterium]